MNSNCDIEWSGDELELLKLLFDDHPYKDLLENLCREYNTRAQMHRFCQRSDQDIIRGGMLLVTKYYERLSEDSDPIPKDIFGSCSSCRAKIPFFLESLIPILRNAEDLQGMKRKRVEEEACGVPEPNLMENLEGGEGGAGAGAGELNLMNIHEPSTSRIGVSPPSSRNLNIHAAAGGSKHSEESVDAQLVVVACAMLAQKLITVRQLVKFFDKAHEFTNQWKTFLLFDTPLGVKAEALAIKLAQI